VDLRPGPPDHALTAEPPVCVATLAERSLDAEEQKGLAIRVIDGRTRAGGEPASGLVIVLGEAG